ncbi:hypothetical protein [Parvicella tangerina]|uniref:Uncharacterized protein n=1 Tax=Parvicella tangerina TaxID=2829795 RepID=A0A916NU28_9FLAO|nr:hypothetical protein [Parvicella tangerina]CAG5086907.1 hypothetical protein CRYO30217_03326 [Parvicella tangerina]
MSFTLFIILIIVMPIVLMGLMAAVFKKKFPDNEIIPGVISLIIVIGAIVLGIWAPRVYVVYEEDGELTYRTQVVFFSYTHETEDGDEIEVDPVGFGCGVLNLSGEDLYLYPECYGDCSGDYGDDYYIDGMTYEPTDEWNIDIFPGEDIPSEVSSKSSTVINYVMYAY